MLRVFDDAVRLSLVLFAPFEGRAECEYEYEFTMYYWLFIITMSQPAFRPFILFAIMNLAPYWWIQLEYVLYTY